MQHPESKLRTLIDEQWKDIDGYEGLYKVSNLGRVKHCAYIRHGRRDCKFGESQLSLKPNTRGYIQAHLCKDGRVKALSVHRLVATAFIPNKDNKPVINHKNGVKTDNRASNLEWCTISENTSHAYHVLGKYWGTPKIKVKCIETGEIFDSSVDAARAKGTYATNIRKCLTGERHTAGGFSWERM